MKVVTNNWIVLSGSMHDL